MQVVVTGASGFLGRVVVRKLRERGGLRVLAVSRTPTALGVRVSDYAETPAGDVLIHLAEESDRKAAQALGVAYERSAAGVLSDLLAKRWKRVVYSSSAVLYGDNHRTPRSPKDPVEANDPYARVKLHGERGVLASGNSAVVRLANLYGPGMAATNVVSTLLRQVNTEGPVKIRDDTPVRDFLWVEDAAEAVSRIALGSLPGVFNVGSGHGWSVRELARLVLDVAGCVPREIMVTHPGNRYSSIILDIRETIDAWNWHPQTGLAQGIEMLLPAYLAGRRD